MVNLIKLIKIDFKNLIKNPMWIFMNFGFPLLLIVVLSVITRQQYSSDFSSFNYYGVSIILFTAFNTSVMSANAFLEEPIKRPNLRIIYSPINISSIYLSKIISTTLFVMISIFSLAGVLNVLNITRYGGVIFWTILFLICLCCSSFGVMMACLFKEEEMANLVTSNLVTVVAAVGGAFFPLGSLGPIFKKIRLISPFTWIQDLLFNLIYDTVRVNVLTTSIWILIITTIFIFICSVSFNQEDYL